MDTWKQLMLTGSVKKYRENQVLHRYQEELMNEGFTVYTFDCRLWDECNYHRDLATTLHFPDYYGNNLHALHDCLTELEAEGGGILLVFTHYDRFAEQFPPVAHAILDTIQAAAWELLLEQVKLVAFVQMSEEDLPFEQLGVRHAEWNDAEFL
ncbi:barnase inhibitor [Pontibacillus halophilus JSM 076056 = DSM 19796]|uniref:Barnase inhibitor n=1 Tax=Pontibacillus halophilus JSM 076056 = DSM 19796 TaxID=1385510 RepID=A0A0A5GGF3_9BACI|nr:barstar family protein [Pontibacillus halophilus]KGX91054.1 barnase inhibitor [Pontibacillus halophilus JSM 076056 = DSM 19796]